MAGTRKQSGNISLNPCREKGSKPAEPGILFLKLIKPQVFLVSSVLFFLQGRSVRLVTAVGGEVGSAHTQTETEAEETGGTV